MTRPAAVPFLPIALDHAGGGLQEQIVSALRAAIAAGTLPAGARLPSIRDLTAALQVSRTTVSLALEKLVDEELLVARLRSGIFVGARMEPTPVPRRPGPRELAASVHLSERGRTLAAGGFPFGLRRPQAFRLSRPALELFPVRQWNKLLAHRASRITLSQLDYEPESPALKAAVAVLVSATRGFRVEPAQVLLFSGSQRALEFAATCLLNPGDAAWMEDPGYPGATQTLRAAGARVVPRAVDGEGLTLRGRRGPAPRLIYVTPSSQFPLGGAMSLARRFELLAFAGATGACLVEDDYEVEFSAAGAQLPALAALDRAGRVLYVGSFSRTTVPALRLGYLIAPPGLAEKLSAARNALEDPLPSIVQLTLADFISGGHFAQHVRRMRKVYAERRRALVEAVERSRHLRLRAPPDGLHAVALLPAGCDDAAVSEAARARGLEALPLSRFCAAVQLGPALVLGYGTVRPEDAGPAVRKLDAAAAACLR